MAWVHHWHPIAGPAHQVGPIGVGRKQLRYVLWLQRPVPLLLRNPFCHPRQPVRSIRLPDVASAASCSCT
jgi:hypothetical protein